MALSTGCGMDLDRLGRIRPCMQQYVDDGKLAGIVTLVGRHGEAVRLEAVGMADLASSVAMASDTIFRIYSMTKPITSVAVMMLHEQGRVLLSAPVSTYIPAFAAQLWHRVELPDVHARVVLGPVEHERAVVVAVWVCVVEHPPAVGRIRAMAIARKRAVAYDSTIVGLVAVQEEPVADIVMATS